MYEFIREIASSTVPTPVAAGIGLLGLGAGIAWMCAAASDKLAAARRLASAGTTYFVRADQARNYIKAIDTPTTAMPLVRLEAATATPTERLRAGVAEIGERVREAVTSSGAPRDWEPGEMTAAFAAIVDGNDWADTRSGQTADVSPWVSPVPRPGTPVPSAPPRVVMAPRGPQAPPRWVDGGAPPPSRARLRRSETGGMPGRLRTWGGSLLGPVPPLELPRFPRPFQTPGQRLPNDPRRMALLPADPTRQWRTRTV